MSKVKVSHVFYSGLGGHTAVFWALEKFSNPDTYDLGVCLYGIEDPMLSTIKGCKEKKISFSFDKKNRKWDIFHPLRLAISIYRTKPNIIFLHGSYGILPIIFLCKWFGGAKVISRETQALNLKNWLYRLRSIFALILCDSIIYLTEDYRDQSMVGWKRRFLNKTTVISNGLDLNFYHPKVADTKPIEHKIVVGMQSRLVRIKDHITLVKTFDVIVNQMKLSNIELQIAGEGITFDEIQHLVTEKGLDDHIKLLGRLEQPDLVSFLNSLDIYVHSSYGETMSNAIMQAQACGLPIIATDVFGINNIIINEENGYLFQLGDVERLTALILMLAQNNAKREEFALISRKFAEERLSNEVMATKYFEVFDSLFYESTSRN